jgi:hypothetical protein
MPSAFILAQISPPEAHCLSVGASGKPERLGSGGDIWTNVKPLPALCRPAGWIALWRTIGALSVLNRKAA